ncbi:MULTISPECIES: NADP-dependent succinic semialdehyde dehydrogenase [Nocardiaceae]|uniref:Succinate-semialdehyde dehydrogenase/glutarate-semialdehyde dehydrogenase n=1 Tax=Rhodococcoides corynebacterioides TaxID=53972 RepID=A0ABS2KZN2_9NOCA|nr:MULTISPECIES: NADP-dependent succinic semialdehyde dehydrogenase [Rhodococcus]MBM7417384.1 succinate-semialdehyde dehydrogenase/glutarate-semialdehyde dehydrogenase [Rhodococcus corynebacterioides]MBP1115638.1 succinate-semialdehyde dehydrogenase/glutarate-semialdehyde dehydrogenase [Rhodococcus sp. PvP016]
MAIATINPATGATVKSFEPMSESEVQEAIRIADARWKQFRTVSFEQRATWMHAAADNLEADIDTVAEMMTLEMGKTLAAARGEAAKCVKGLRFYADNAEAMLADEALPGGADTVGASRAYTRYESLGVVLAVMPWNYPFWQVLRFAAPALMAGNVGLLKHASNVPQCAMYIQDLFERSGFPKGCFQTLLISAGQVEGVLRDPRVAAATITGSEWAGRSVASICGDEIKPSVLELGGNDPFIVMPSADLESAVATAVTARTQNNGQSCIAAKRFLVHADVYDQFTTRFVEAMSALVVGDPVDDTTDVGPLATSDGRDEVKELVDDAIDKGASILCGGRALDGPGWYFQPTVISDISSEMRVNDEEVFGPVAMLHRVTDMDDAIAVANSTPFGLGSSAWTSSREEQDRFAAEIAAGQVFINGMTTSYPELPFGGTKRSGYGRELSYHGLREFCNAKTVWVK